MEDLPDVNLEGGMDNFGAGGGDDGGEDDHNESSGGPLGNPLIGKAKEQLKNLNSSKIGYILAALSMFCMMVGVLMLPLILVNPGSSLYWFSISSFFAIISMFFLLGRERFMEGFLTGARRLYFGGWTVGMFLSWWEGWSGPIGITSSVGTVNLFSI